MKEKGAKYNLVYCSGATGYGWKHDYDTLEEFEDFVDEKRTDYTARLQVWDYQLRKFIFWKDALTYEPRIDYLHDIWRDMRTKDRQIKLK